MILLADIPDLDSSPSALTNTSRRTSDRDRRPRNQASTPPGTCCLRCGGLLVLSYMASLESDLSGRPMRLWRCVNCGDYIDHDILANRWNGPVPARETTDSRANIVFPQPVKSCVLEVRMPKTEEAKKNAITVPINHVLVSRVSSHERSSRHG
ncbi:hypothetical protein AYO43_06120 [Nitrospira sp. SCGC AG-212-E16]|nr:hypothetical protein AYO43_06120 [Nitrospira sp. SCGC AG-212-E16]